MIRRIAGTVLIAFAAIVGLHTIIEPLYHVSTAAAPFSPHWSWLNWLIGIGILSGILHCIDRKRRTHTLGGTAAHVANLAINVSFFGLLFLAVLFFFNLAVLVGDGFLAAHPGVLHVLTIFVRAAFPIVIGAIGVSLWNAQRE